MKRGAEDYKFIKDHLGSVKFVVKVSDGSITQAIEYDEFGKILSDSNPGFQPFGFAGGIYDPQANLTKFGVRDYDGEVGRWLTKDPIRFDGGDPNLYGYVLVDPVNYVDPSGEIPLALLLLPALSPSAVTALGAVGAAGLGYCLGQMFPMAQKGKQNMKDSGLDHLSDAEIQELVKSSKGKNKTRYQQAQKERETRNKNKNRKGKRLPPRRKN